MFLRRHTLACTIMSLAAVMASRVPHASASCSQAASTAEAHARLPTGLLEAIGQVESGNWGWSVNANDGSVGRRFGSAEEAQQYTEELLGSGRRTIDVGCFQIDLAYHPDAFPRWRDAFDEDENADAAATILRHLHDQYGDWHRAIAFYHSADQQRGATYLRAVLDAWTGQDEQAAAIDPYVIVMEPGFLRKAAWHVNAPSEARAGVWRSRERLPKVILP